MARIELCQAVLEAARGASQPSRYLKLNESQKKALDLLVSIINANRDVPLGAVQGPPGTGKTSIIEAFAETALPGFLEEVGARDLILYVAPTNYLAVQAFTRITAALLARGGFKLRDILDMTRVYGHKIVPGRCKELERRYGIPEELVKRVAYGDIEPGVVRLIFSTEFQRVSGRLRGRPGKTHLIVDEASKSPYFRAFISVADEIMRFSDYPASLVALGDPEQAIAVPEGFRSSVPLLMNKIIKILHELSLENDNYVFLNITYRIPKPSEEPISHGFYDGRLQAHHRAEYKLRSIKYIFEDNRRRVIGLLRSLGADDSETMRIHDAIYGAVTSDTPIVVLDTRREFTPASRKVPTYDAFRARVATKAALVLQAYASIEGDSSYFKTIVTSPYSDMASNIGFVFASKYASRASRLLPPDSVTVHSLIGGEADAIVAVMGKEYMSGSLRPSLLVDDNALLTIYFNEPQVLNVQLSRHKRLLVLVGSVDRLAAIRGRREWRKLSRTAERIIDLERRGQALRLPLRT